jgi:hypothetical protein
MMNAPAGATPVDGTVKLALGLLAAAFAVVVAELAGVGFAAWMAGEPMPRLALSEMISLLLGADVDAVTGVTGATVPFWAAFTATFVLLAAVAVVVWRPFAMNNDPSRNPERMPGLPSAQAVAKIAGEKSLLK